MTKEEKQLIVNTPINESCFEKWQKGAEFGYNKAKEIIKKFLKFVNNEVEFDPEHPQEHTDLWNELREEAEQFISEKEYIMKKLNIYLCLKSVKHLKDKSYHNCNYYELEPYGDWCIFFNGNNIVEEIRHEDEDYCSYTLGHFEGDEFVAVLKWTGDWDETLF